MSIAETTGSTNTGMFSSFGAVAANYLQDKMLKKMDTDGGGTVGQSEFQAALEKVGATLGVDSSDAAGMFASVDADGNGELIGSEVGQIIKNVFSGGGGTGAFVQSRGDETRFSELDTDGDGMISKAEFGIGAEGEAEAVGEAGEAGEFGDAIAGAQGDASTTDAASGLMASGDTAPASALNEDALQALMGQVDADGDGQISATELTAFASQMGGQMEAASKRYNDTAMASFSTRQVSEKA